MPNVPIVTELTFAELEILVAANGLNEGLQYKVTDKGWLLTATGVNNYIMNNSVPYISYSAILNQTNTELYPGDTIVIGKEYQIFEIFGTDDFSNIGFVNTDTPFIATGNSPTLWESTPIIDCENSHPTHQVLSNQIGEITYQRIGHGNYNAISDALFVENKTITIITNYTLDNSFIGSQWDSLNEINIQTLGSDGQSSDNRLTNVYFEIRVYAL